VSLAGDWPPIVLVTPQREFHGNVAALNTLKFGVSHHEAGQTKS